MTTENGGNSRLLTTTQVAARCGIHRNTVYALINRGLLPGVWFGDTVRVPEAALDKFIQAGGAKPERNELNTYRSRRAAGARGRHSR